MAKISKKNSLKMKKFKQKRLKQRGGGNDFEDYFKNDDNKKKIFKHIKEMILKKDKSHFNELFTKAASETKINEYLEIIKKQKH
jgi:hypothetical protein